MSLYAGVCDIKAGVQFVNVIDSAHDPNVREFDVGGIGNGPIGWLGLWKRMAGGGRDVNCIACNSSKATVGGHIVLRGSDGSGPDRYAQNLEDSNRVFTAPICYACNASDFTDGRERIFRAKYDSRLVHLCAFMKDSLPPYDCSSAFWEMEDDAYQEWEAERYRAYEEERQRKKAEQSKLDAEDAIILSASAPSIPAFRAGSSRISRPVHCSCCSGH